MGTENYSGFGYCPSQAKKSKTSTKHRTNNNIQQNNNIQIVRSNNYPEWNCLPAVVLHEIYDLLTEEDRKNASCVCRHWRQIIFHPKYVISVITYLLMNGLYVD